MREKKNYKNKLYGKNSIMKIFIIVLFFILILFLSITVSMDIEKLEVYNKKIIFKIKIKIYIFKYIKVFQKKIHKKDIIKLMDNITKKKIIKDEKIIKNIKYSFKDLKINIEYGIKNTLINAYAYGIINMIIPMLLAKQEVKNMEYNITTNFRKNFISIKIRGKIQIQVLENVIKKFKQTKIKSLQKHSYFRKKYCIH